LSIPGCSPVSEPMLPGCVPVPGWLPVPMLPEPLWPPGAALAPPAAPAAPPPAPPPAWANAKAPSPSDNVAIKSNLRIGFSPFSHVDVKSSLALG
jgi:hypothetical protein